MDFGKGEGAGRYLFPWKPKFWNRFSQKTGAQSVIRHGPLFRHGPKIFCAASHTVGYNKLCGIYLIFRLDLNYVMGSQLQRMVFELLELLSAVNMLQFGRFYTLTWFCRHFRCIIQI